MKRIYAPCKNCNGKGTILRYVGDPTSAAVNIVDETCPVCQGTGVGNEVMGFIEEETC